MTAKNFLFYFALLMSIEEFVVAKVERPEGANRLLRTLHLGQQCYIPYVWCICHDLHTHYCETDEYCVQTADANGQFVSDCSFDQAVAVETVARIHRAALAARIAEGRHQLIV